MSPFLMSYFYSRVIKYRGRSIAALHLLASELIACPDFVR